MLRGALTDPADSRRCEAFHDAPRETAHDEGMRRNASMGVPARFCGQQPGRQVPGKNCFWF
jgi:hypothetical protein